MGRIPEVSLPSSPHSRLYHVPNISSRRDPGRVRCGAVRGPVMENRSPELGARLGRWNRSRQLRGGEAMLALL